MHVGYALRWRAYDLGKESSMRLTDRHAWRYSVSVPITDEDKLRRRRFAAYLEQAMRAASYVRPNGDPDVPALSRMSGVPDPVLRRWLAEGGDPSVPNMRLVASALGLEPRQLYVASELFPPEEVGLDKQPAVPAPPPKPPTPEERIMADDLLSEEDKSALIHTLHRMRERRSPTQETGRRKRA